MITAYVYSFHCFVELMKKKKLDDLFCPYVEEKVFPSLQKSLKSWSSRCFWWRDACRTSNPLIQNHLFTTSLCRLFYKHILNV